MAAAEVLVKLVVDSNAPKATADLKHGLEKAEKSQKHLTKGLLDGKANLASLASVGVAGYTALAAAASFGAAAVVGLAIGATHAFLESEQQVRALAGTLTLLDTSGTGFEAMMDLAGDLKDELEEVAMAVGATDDALVAAYTDVIERGNKTIDQAKELTEAMANAGRAVPGGIGTLSGAFEQIEMGAIRAKNPIVGMIASTHMLQGNAKSVAKQMQAMTPEKQMELAEKAIAKMAKKMKDVPMSIEEMSTSMKVFVGNIFEDAGQPIVENLMPLFTTIRKFAFDNSEVFKDVAKEFGGMVGKVVNVALPVSKEIMNAIKGSSGEIKKLMDAVIGPGKDAFKYIYENKEAFAKTMGDVFSKMIEATRFLAETMASVSVHFTDIAKLAAKLSPGGSQLMAEERRTAAGKAAVTMAQQRGGLKADPAGAKRVQEEFEAAHQAATGGDAVTAAIAFKDMILRAEETHNDAIRKASMFREVAIGGDAAAFARAWKIASASNDQGVKDYVTDFINMSAELKKALMEKGPALLGEGFAKLIESLQASGLTKIGGELSAAQAKALKDSTKIGDTKVNQYIGTVNVKQDFKDMDPERVAIVFRNDLARLAASPIQPRRL